MRIDADEFLLEDTEEMKKIKRLEVGMKGVRKYAFSLLARVFNIHKRLKEGERDPLLIGKGVGFLLAFSELAKVSGMTEATYRSTVEKLLENFGQATVEARERLNEMTDKVGDKTVTIQHKRDPKSVEVDAQRVAVREKEQELREVRIVDEREEKAKEESERLPEMDKGKARVVELIVEALSGSTLRYSKKEARERAMAVYRQGATTEELVGDACRASI